jgi:hypothetical protein
LVSRRNGGDFLELFWIIVCYIAILAVCFLVGEYLHDCRVAKGQKLSLLSQASAEEGEEKSHDQSASAAPEEQPPRE